MGNMVSPSTDPVHQNEDDQGERVRKPLLSWRGSNEGSSSLAAVAGLASLSKYAFQAGIIPYSRPDKRAGTGRAAFPSDLSSRIVYRLA